MSFLILHIWILETWSRKGNLSTYINMKHPGSLLCQSGLTDEVWKKTGILGAFYYFFLNSPRPAAVSFSMGAGADNNLCIRWQWNHAFLLILLLTVKWLVCYRDRAIWQHLKISVHQRLKTILIVSIKVSLTPIVGWWICPLLFITFLYLHLFITTAFAACGFIALINFHSLNHLNSFEIIQISKSKLMNAGGKRFILLPRWLGQKDVPIKQPSLHCAALESLAHQKAMWWTIQWTSPATNKPVLQRRLMFFWKGW